MPRTIVFDVKETLVYLSAPGHETAVRTKDAMEAVDAISAADG